ncbi:uncharacterized protein LOC123676078 [Harmonia axyridis]|uniref:uncharacterized protein LOC123676078 n=1 Tax=Harmonia axyridis TaxID=115357 RepID=UPI001E277863|nr:uncharacterized protein LOC123676078 [Harmonia axyridis]
MNSFVTENTSKARSLRLFVDDLCRKTRPATEIMPVKSSDGQVLTSKEKMVEEFGTYFSKIGKRLAKNIDGIPQRKEGDRYCNNTLFLVPISEDEVRGMMRELKNGGSLGNNGIRTELIKNIQEEIIIEPIMLLANLYFETAEFSNIFKEGHICTGCKKRSSRENLPMVGWKHDGSLRVNRPSKAFDTVSHKKLLRKFHLNGFRGKALK